MNKNIIVGVAGIGAVALGIYLWRHFKSSPTKIFDNTYEQEPSGTTCEPGYQLDSDGKCVKVLPESDFKITQLIAGYPVMKVAIDIPEGKVFNAQFALGHWFPNGQDVPSLDISSTISAIYPEMHLIGASLTGDFSSMEPNLHYKIGNGVFVADPCTKSVMGTPWLMVGGYTINYYTTQSDWVHESNYNGFKALEWDRGLNESYRKKVTNPVSTNYSIVDTLATNIDCGEGYYYNGRTCVPGTHPANPYINQKYDVCVILYERNLNEDYDFNQSWNSDHNSESPITLIPRDYMIALNAVTTGNAISENDGSESKPYLYVEGWQGQGYYKNVPGTNGSAKYVSTLEDFNSLV